MILFDCEIQNLIPAQGQAQDAAYRYCNGWGDFDGMEVAVICTYDFLSQETGVWMKDNLAEFGCQIRNRTTIGYNNLNFDDKLLAANGLKAGRSADLLAMIRAKKEKKGAGYSLNNMALANGISPKSGHGSLAPILWQEGKIGELINYCLHDIEITKRLIEKARLTPLKDPNGLAPIDLRSELAEALQGQ